MADGTVQEILDKLLERRDKIVKELSALENLIVVYRGLSTREISESPDQGQLRLGLGGARRAVQAAAIARSIEAVRRIIINEGRPMRRGELARRLEAEGFALPGGDKNKVLGTNIWRSGRFRTIEGSGYWPKDVSLPR